jgi:hypothetical protein
MKNGRPADGHYTTYFYPEGDSLKVESLAKATDVSRKQFYSGQC